MAIEIKLENKNVEINLEGYGQFTLRRLGALEELEYQKANLRFAELQNKLKEAATEASEGKENLKDIDALSAEVGEISEKTVKLMEGVFSSQDPKAVKKLFKEQSLDTIAGIIKKAFNE